MSRPDTAAFSLYLLERRGHLGPRAYPFLPFIAAGAYLAYLLLKEFPAIEKMLLAVYP